MATTNRPLIGGDLDAVDELIDTQELARRTGTSVSMWTKRRLLGGDETPQFLKLGSVVRYRWSTVQCWIQKRERGSTSQAATADAA